MFARSSRWFGSYIKVARKKIASVFGNVRHVASSHQGNVSPLSGIRVIDLTRIVAGPYCTMVLGDLGAELLKIEQPGSGDEARKWGPPFIPNSNVTCYFVCLNRNKKSVCVNLKSKEGVSVIHDLAKVCDVLIENYVPGKLDELGIGYNDLKNVAPHLVYCSLSGYGPTGPYSKRPGYDVIAASMGGLLHCTGPEDGEPVKVGVAMTDMATGLFAHGAILAALLQRTKTGQGQKIDCDLLSSQVATLINLGSNYLNAGKEAKRWGTAHESIVPYQTFATSDGYLTICAGTNQQFSSLCHKISMPELAEDPKFCDNMQRVKHRDILIKELKKCFAKKRTSEWLCILEGSSFPYGQVNTFEQVFNDPHIKAIELVKEVTLDTGEKVRVVGPPVKYSGSYNDVRSPPPSLGQHTITTLRDLLNYSDEKINKLIKSGAIQ